MSKYNVFHIRPDPQHWWQVFRGTYLLSVHDSKTDAVEEGAQLADHLRPSRLLVQTVDGQVETSTTYAEGPATRP